MAATIYDLDQKPSWSVAGLDISMIYGQEQTVGTINPIRGASWVTRNTCRCCAGGGGDTVCMKIELKI